MKKLLLAILIILILVCGSIYTLLFTKIGNSYVAKYIENSFNKEQKEFKLKVDSFLLTFSNINFSATINDSSYIDINGDLAIFKQSVDLKYGIKIKDLSMLNHLVNQNLKGSFDTNGTFKGDKTASFIIGKTNLAASNTEYEITLENFNPKDILLNSKGLKIEELLPILNQKEYVNGLLNLAINIKDFNKPTQNGQINADISQATILAKAIKETLNKDFTDTPFNLNFKGVLDPQNLNFNTNFNSSILNLALKDNSFNIKNNSLNSIYKIDFLDLKKLQPIIGVNISEKPSLEGKLIFAKKDINTEGLLHFINSNINYKVALKDFNLSSIEASSTKLKIEDILKLLSEPNYANGNLELSCNLTNSSKNILNGVATIKTQDAKLVNNIINSHFNQNIKQAITFNSIVDTKIKDNDILLNAQINSNIANFSVNDVVFKQKDELLTAKYILDIPSLDKLYDITNMKLRGDFKIAGNIKKHINKFSMDGDSDLAKGKLDFRLLDNDLNVKIKDSKMRSLLYTLDKNEFFDSNINANLDYNLLTKKGELQAKLTDGHFLANSFTNLIQKFTKLDLTQEIYHDTSLNSKIDNQKLISNFIMHGANSKIESKDSIIDLEKEYIDTKLRLQIKENKVDITLKDHLNDPTIHIDAKELIENLLEKQIEKKLDKNKGKIEQKLNKLLKDDDDDSKKKLIDGIKSIF